MYGANAARCKPSKGKTKRIGRVWNTEEFQKNFFGKKNAAPSSNLYYYRNYSYVPNTPANSKDHRFHVLRTPPDS